MRYELIQKKITTKDTKKNGKDVSLKGHKGAKQERLNT
jgi:hypothetical protein